MTMKVFDNDVAMKIGLVVYILQFGKEVPKVLKHFSAKWGKSILRLGGVALLASPQLLVL